MLSCEVVHDVDDLLQKDKKMENDEHQDGHYGGFPWAASPNSTEEERDTKEVIMKDTVEDFHVLHHQTNSTEERDTKKVTMTDTVEDYHELHHHTNSTDETDTKLNV